MKYPLYVLTTLLLLVLLAGCVPADTSNTDGDAAADETTVETVETEGNAAADETSVVEGEAAVADQTECEEGFRLVEHAEGSDCIPQNVERVAVLAPSVDQLFLALDYTPAATSDAIQILSSEFPVLTDQVSVMMSDLPIVSFPPNLEVLAEAEPDVIISGVRGDLIPDLAEEIAPVVVISSAEDWKQNMLFVADIMGERAAAEALLAGYEERVQVLRETLQNRAETTVSHVFIAPDFYAVRLPASFGGQVLIDVGLALPEAQLALIDDGQALVNDVQFNIAQERLDLLDGDVLLYYTIGPAGQEGVDALEDSPVFQALSATQNDAVHQVGGYWQLHGIYSAHAVLDDLFRYVADVDPQEVSPNPFVNE